MPAMALPPAPDSTMDNPPTEVSNTNENTIIEKQQPEAADVEMQA